MAIQEADDSETEDDKELPIPVDDANSNSSWTCNHKNLKVNEGKKEIEWKGDALVGKNGLKFYRYDFLWFTFNNS